MVKEFKFPDVGEGITEGKLVHWKVKVGEEVKVDDVVAEVETDKAVVDIPSPFLGKVVELLNKEGDTIDVGNVIMKVADSGEVVEEKTNLDEGVAQEKVVEEVNSKEEKIEEREEINSQSPSSSSSDVKAMPAVRKAARDKGIDLSSVNASGKSGQVLMSDLDGGKVVENAVVSLEEKVSIKQQEEVQKVETKVLPPLSQDVLASPSIRKKARELGIDLNEIKGSGDNGRIIEQDLVNTSTDGDNRLPTNQGLERDSNGDKGLEIKQGSSNVDSTAISRIALNGIRGVIAKRMQESLQKSAQVTFSDEANLTKLVKLRKEEKEKLEKRGIKLTYLPFFIKAYVQAAREFREFNALVDDAKNEVELMEVFNAGVAVDTPKGLMVPVIFDAQNKSILDIANEIVDISNRAREGKLTGEEMKGSTFTISSVGNLGGGVFTPIINYPEVAIMGIGKISKKPIVENNEIKIADVCTFSLTFDHRVVDGADSARFLKAFIELIEDPDLLLMGSASSERGLEK